jgi:hypothetical protein
LPDHSHPHVPEVESLDAAQGFGPFRSFAAAVEGFGDEQEWIMQGHASRFGLIGEYTPNGRWNAEPAECAGFAPAEAQLAAAADLSSPR